MKLTRELMDSGYAGMRTILWDLSEEELRKALKYEVAHAQRKGTIEKLHAAYTRKRSVREREELLSGNFRL